MLDADITRPGQDLLAAYRAHTGPSPEAVERLAAALHADLAKEATAPLASAEPRPDLETADAVARVLVLAPPQRSRPGRPLRLLPAMIGDPRGRGDRCGSRGARRSGWGWGWAPA